MAHGSIPNVPFDETQTEDSDLQSLMQKYEKHILYETLSKNNFNISQSAKQLGIHRQALQYRMKKYNLVNVHP